LKITEEMQGDLDCWRYIVSEDVTGDVLQVNICALVMRDPDLIMLSDASYTSVGGFCMQTEVYWCRELSLEEKSRLVRSKKPAKGDGSLHINLLRLYGMVMTAYMMIIVEGMRPGPGGGTILLRGDNKAAIHWILCGGGRGDPRVGSYAAFYRHLNCLAVGHLKPTTSKESTTP
jgi:hypothetical protein